MPANTQQPRRVAAMTVAMRVAEELGCDVGKEVGYSVRFEDVTSPSTRIKFLTDGMLIRELMSDPDLTRYSVVMVDEAHERSISTDLLLGLLKRVQQRRPDLRIVVSSATIQAEEFHTYFNRDEGTDEGANSVGEPVSDEPKAKSPDRSNIIILEGRTHPVDVFYLEDEAENYVDKAVDTVFDIHAREPDGDILVFFSGRDEIESALQAIADRHGELEVRGRTLMPLPLYAGLSTEQQMLIFDKTPQGMRKVVFATNIAEASVTIDGVVYVVDCGFSKLRVFDATTGIESLSKLPISKASALQRTGRAGRICPGKCFRLYAEQTFQALLETTVPELQRSNLAPALLQLKALGVENLVRFDFLSPPPSKAMARALELLFSLGALDGDANLTQPLGTRMAELPVEPMMAKTLLSATDFGCLDEILSIAAMTSLDGAVWFYRDGEESKMKHARARFAAQEGDHLTLYNVYQAFTTAGDRGLKFCRENYLNFKSMQKAVSIRNQLRRNIQLLGVGVVNPPSALPNCRDPSTKANNVRKCLTSGYFSHAARMQADGTFRNVKGNTTLWPHPNSLMFNIKADWVIYHEAVETADKIFLRDVTAIEKEWLAQYAPHMYKIHRPVLG